MTLEELAKYIVSFHHPNLNEKEHTVYMLCSDGEQIYTKAKEIFGQRTFHMFKPACFSNNLKTLLDNMMPDNPKVIKGKYIFISTDEEIKKIYDAVAQFDK